VDRDVCVSGPDTMIIKAAEALRESGARPDRLRYDLPDEIG
jgi:hypothetical protein